MNALAGFYIGPSIYIRIQCVFAAGSSRFVRARLDDYAGTAFTVRITDARTEADIRAAIAAHNRASTRKD